MFTFVSNNQLLYYMHDAREQFLFGVKSREWWGCVCRMDYVLRISTRDVAYTTNSLNDFRFLSTVKFSIFQYIQLS